VRENVQPAQAASDDLEAQSDLNNAQNCAYNLYCHASVLQGRLDEYHGHEIDQHAAAHIIRRI
jgi:hypothetical protein